MTKTILELLLTAVVMLLGTEILSALFLHGIITTPNAHLTICILWVVLLAFHWADRALARLK